MFGSCTYNVNPKTGIRYGVTARIPDFIWGEVYGWASPGEDEARIDAYRARAKELLRGGIEAGTDDELADWPDDTVTDFVDEHDQYFCDKLDFELLDFARYGEVDGVKLRLFGCGGAPLLWVLESPYLASARLCSPCIPNAGDLDSPSEDGYECYGLPPDWCEASDDCR